MTKTRKNEKENTTTNNHEHWNERQVDQESPDGFPLPGSLLVWMYVCNLCPLVFGSNWLMNLNELEETLWSLVKENKIECGMNEEGEVVYWMTDEQVERYNKEQSND